MKQLVREPLVHFLALGALLFVAYGWLAGESTPAPGQIVVDADRVKSIETQFRRTWQRSPSAEELAGLVQAWVREEVLYREGLALGLDRGDPVVRRRIVQKMDFITDGLDVSRPDELELEVWLAEHPDRYRVDPVYNLRQVYFDPTRFDTGAGGAVAAAREMLASGEVGSTTGATLLPDMLHEAPAREVARIFGQQFLDALADAPERRWHGPVRSGFGVHLVFVEERRPERLAALAEVRDAVERDLLAARRDQTAEALYRALRERYRVRYDGVAESARADDLSAGTR